MTEQKQLELTLAGIEEASCTNNESINQTPAKRSSRADWWFRQMRQVVDRAFDWQPAPRFRPEQIWLPETARRF